MFHATASCSQAALKHGIRNPESGIRKRNHGNGNGNGIWERGIQEINFKIIIIIIMIMMMMIIIIIITIIIIIIIIIINKTEKMRL